MTGPLAGQVAVITGASRGIGAAVSCALSGAGARVARLARSLPEREEEWGLDVPCDVTDPAQVEAAAQRIAERLGRPSVVINNAGGFLVAPVTGTTPEQFDAQLAVNLRGPFLVARAFLPMLREGGGRHVLIGSVADHTAFAENAAYAASKFGARGLHEVLRAECRGTGVVCSLVSPGPTNTRLWDPVQPENRPGFLPRRDMLTPEDVAQAVAFVATRPPHVEIDWLRINPA